MEYKVQFTPFSTVGKQVVAHVLVFFTTEPTKKGKSFGHRQSVLLPATADFEARLEALKKAEATLRETFDAVSSAKEQGHSLTENEVANLIQVEFPGAYADVEAAAKEVEA